MAGDILQFLTSPFATPHKDIILALGTDVIKPSKIGQLELGRWNLRKRIKSCLLYTSDAADD